MTAIKFASKVKESFALPEVCVTLRKMLDNPQTNTDDIAALISIDPSLCSKLLKLANSSLFRFRSQVSSISKAINIIGGEALYILVMSETAANAYQQFQSEIIDLKRFWKQSVLCGLLAQNLSKSCRVRGSEHFFLMGLLNNFSELVIAKQAPKVAQSIESEIDSAFPWESQHKHLRFYYADCTAEILKSWDLPEQLYAPLRQIHNAEEALKHKDIAVLYLAYRTALKATFEGKFKHRNPIEGRVMDSMGLLYEDLDALIKQTQMEAKEMLHLLNPDLF
ncbi:HDOD domain-containing protein [Alteromonas sp. a30]|uniref:HDOD domain-containing protein n=1 Tax=Alteromonas sp. a30 TaxID=2730917 RepID=UPI0022818FB5|nr:HDOD domain-containing protein [Alteromonas sp. a30]MCY7294662.1 HDOD domain-containing protein [Alteromonas sp. a30]